MKQNNIKQTSENQSKKLSAKSLALIITASILLAAIITWSVIGIVSYVRSQSPIDFLKDNLNPYINIEEEDYKNYDITINIPKPSDKDIDHKILALLAKHKGELLNDGKYSTNEKIDAGDKAYIWYTGYELDENGKRIDLANTSNFGNQSADEITVGLSDLVAGFDLSLIGKVPADYSTFSKNTMGRVGEGDVVYLTASYVLETGAYYENAEIRIDLRAEDVEEKWGVGILDFLEGTQIGFLNSKTATLELKGKDESITFIDWVVDYTTNCEESPLVIDVVFPYDYSDESFRNKKVYFDVYIDKTLDYTPAVFDDTFVTEKIKATAEELADYKGETLTDKYRDMIYGTLMDEYEQAVRDEAVDIMWEHLRSVANVKKLPKYEVTRIYDNYYYGFQEGFTNYTDYYESLDAYICASLGLDDNADWKLHLQEMVNDEVAEKLIFYYIMRKENLTPTDEEFKVIYRSELENDFFYYSGMREDDYLNAEEYNKAISSYEKMIIDYYGQEKYNETVYYNYVTDKLIEMANLVNEAK